MMTTEEQARQKWCPFVRTAWAMNAADDTAALCTANRGNTDNDCLCIASDCMAWRGAWRKKVTDRSCWDKEELASKPTAPGKDWERIGYCGLAGKP